MKVKMWRVTVIYGVFTVVSTLLPRDAIEYVSEAHSVGAKVNIVKLF